MIILDFHNDLRHLVIDVALFSHLSAYLFGGIHDSRVVPVSEMGPNFRKR